MLRKRNLKIKFVRLSNGEEFPSEVIYRGLTSDQAVKELMNDAKLVGNCDIRIKEIEHL